MVREGAFERHKSLGYTLIRSQLVCLISIEGRAQDRPSILVYVYLVVSL